MDADRIIIEEEEGLGVTLKYLQEDTAFPLGPGGDRKPLGYFLNGDKGIPLFKEPPPANIDLIPAIRDMLHTRYGAEKVRQRDTFTSVATGLAIVAQYL